MKTLTARLVEGAKPKPGKRLEIADHVVRGLSLRVADSGARSWALRYRTIAGQQRRLTLGAYPALSLVQARAEANKALGAIAAERDPALEKRNVRQKARLDHATKPQTLNALWTVYEREKLQRKRSSTAAYQSWLWRRHIQPRLGDHNLATLDRATARAALKEIGETAPVTANRALALLRHVLNYAVDEEFLPASPLARMGAFYAERSRARVLSDNELRAFWRTLEAASERTDIQVGRGMATALKLILLTATRAGEVAGIDAAEIDCEARSWTVPADRMKSRRAHVVPLSSQAWELLCVAFGNVDARRWNGPAFPNTSDSAVPMTRHALTRAMARIVRETRLDGSQSAIPRATAHDLRRTAATMIASERIGAPPHVVGAVLGHAHEGPTAVYNRYAYVSEKRSALEGWAGLLRRIVASPEVTD